MKGNRSRLLGLAVGILGIIETFGPQMFPPEYTGYIMTGIGIAIFLLREITNTPAGKSE